MQEKERKITEKQLAKQRSELALCTFRPNLACAENARGRNPVTNAAAANKAQGINNSQQFKMKVATPMVSCGHSKTNSQTGQ